MNRRWIAAIALSGAIAAASVGGAVLAQTNSGTPTPAPTAGQAAPVKPYTQRLAEKLGIPEAQLKDAMQAANREMQNEAIAKRLAKLVTDGKLTQAQADEYLAWWNSRPASFPGGKASGIADGRGFGFGPAARPHGRFPGRVGPEGPPPFQKDQRPAPATSATGFRGVSY